MAYKRRSPMPVVEGGLGVQANTAYAVLTGGTTATGSVQSIASVGTSGQVLTSNGAGALPSFQTISGGYSYTAVSSGPYTVLSTDVFIGVTSSSAGISILLPDAPSTARHIVIKDTSGNCSTYNITVTTVGGTVTIDGQTSYTMNADYQSIDVLFDGTTYQIF